MASALVREGLITRKVLKAIVPTSIYNSQREQQFLVDLAIIIYYVPMEIPKMHQSSQTTAVYVALPIQTT